MEPTGTKMIECDICFYQSQARQFTPITVSADFRALECPKCLNNDPDYLIEVTVAKSDNTRSGIMNVVPNDIIKKAA